MAATPAKAAPAAAPAPEAQPVSAEPLKISTAIAHRIKSGAGRSTGGSSLLDFILVCGAMLMIAGGLYGLFMVKDIDSSTLPIIASLLSFMTGSILGAYAGYRWGASDTMKKASADPSAK